MRRRWRIAAIAGSVVAVGAMALVFRTLSAAGVFTDITPGFSGTCQAVAGITGGADIAVDRRAGLAFIAASDRRAPGDARDGLYLLQIGHPELGVTRLAGTPRDFHPLAVSLYRGGDGALTLMALDRRGAGEFSVDIFSVTQSIAADGTVGASLEERASVRSSQFSSPNDLVAAGRDRFFLANGREEGTSFAGVLGSYLTLPSANIVYYDGQVPRVVADGLRYADGLALSQGGGMLYVTQRVGRNIRTYTVQRNSGALYLSGDYPLPAGPDHIDADADGRLWVAGLPKLFAYDRYARNKSAARPPAEIFRVTTTSGIPAGVSAVYTGLGKRIGAASVAVFAGGHLIIGSRYDDHVLVCTPR